jgi:hypothetical protein
MDLSKMGKREFIANRLDEAPVKNHRHCEERSFAAIHEAVQSLETPRQAEPPHGLPGPAVLAFDGSRRSALTTMDTKKNTRRSTIPVSGGAVFVSPAARRSASADGRRSRTRETLLFWNRPARAWQSAPGRKVFHPPARTVPIPAISPAPRGGKASPRGNGPSASY